MDEKYIQDLYDHLGGQSKFGKFDDFKELISTDAQYRKDFHSSFGDKQLGGYDDFDELVKKKEQTTPKPSKPLGTPSALPVQEIPVVPLEKEIPITDPITASLQAEEKKKATKEVSSVSAIMPLAGATALQFEADDVVNKEGQDESSKLAKQGYDSAELANEHRGLTANDYGRKGFSKDELLYDKKNNEQVYHRKTSRLKWQSGLENILSEKLINGNIDKDNYDGINNVINSSLQSSNVGDYTQQRQNINDVANIIKDLGGEKKDELLKNYAVEVAKIYGNSYKSQSNLPNKKATIESNYLPPDAVLGYQYLHDISPDKAEQYQRLFIDPKTLKDKPDELNGYNHLMQILKETSINLEDNAVKEDLNNLSNIAEANGGLTAEQMQEVTKLEEKKKEILQAKNELDQKYPDRITNKVDDAMQEITGQSIGWLNYLGGMTGKGIKNTGEGVWEAVSSPFMSDESNNMRELAIMGETLQENKVYHKTDENKALVSDKLIIKPELQGQIDEIVNDKTLTKQQQQNRLYPLLKQNTDKFWRAPVEGGNYNISPSSILYSLTDLGTQLVPFFAIEAATGGIGGAGTAAKFIRTFIAASSTGFHDEYANALLEGKPKSEAYKQAMGMTAINAAGMAGAGTAEKVRAFYTGAKSSAAQIIAGMTDEAIEKGIAKGASKGMKAFGESIKDRIKATPKMIAGGLKSGAEFETAMAGANELKHQIYNTEIDREQNFKQAVLGVMNFGGFAGIMGQIGYKTPTELQKSGFVSFGKNPEGFKATAQMMLKEGQLTKDEFEQRNILIDKSAEAYKSLPTENAKGKKLTESQKAEYIYNSVIKNEGKKSAANLPPKQAAKAEHTALVADHANDLILEPKTEKQLIEKEKELQKILEPKKDENNKVIELNDNQKKDAEAELEAVQNAIKAIPVPEVKAVPNNLEIKSEVADNTQQKGEVDNPLKDVESTTKALGILTPNQLEGGIPLVQLEINGYKRKPSEDYERKDPNSIAKAFHIAKLDGTNPELVKAVESLLSKEQPKGKPKALKTDNPSGENLALKDVESTTKALEELYDKGGDITIKDGDTIFDTPENINFKSGTVKALRSSQTKNAYLSFADIAEKYHDAKSKGIENDLTKAVESLLGKETKEKPTDSKPKAKAGEPLARAVPRLTQVEIDAVEKEINERDYVSTSSVGSEGNAEVITTIIKGETISYNKDEINQVNEIEKRLPTKMVGDTDINYLERNKESLAIHKAVLQRYLNELKTEADKPKVKEVAKPKPMAGEDVDSTTAKVLDKEGLKPTLKKNGENELILQVDDTKGEGKRSVGVIGLKMVEVDGKKFLSIGMTSVREGYEGKGLATNMYRYLMENLPAGYDGILSPKETRWNNEQIPKIHEKLSKEYNKTELNNGDIIFKPKSESLLSKEQPKANEVSKPTDVQPLKDIHSNNNELAEIGTDKEYQGYIKTIFQESKVNTPVYRADAYYEKNEGYLVDKTNVKEKDGEFAIKSSPYGIYFASDKNVAGIYDIHSKGENINTVILDFKNPKKLYAPSKFVDRTAENEGIDFQNLTKENIDKLKSEGYDSIVVDVDAHTLPANKYHGEEKVPYKENFELIAFDKSQVHVLGSKYDIEGFKNWKKEQKSDVQEPKDDVVDNKAEIKKLEVERDAEVEKVSKPDLKLNLVSASDLANSKDAVKNKKQHDIIKDNFKKIKRLIECL